MKENIDIITVCYNSSHFVLNILESLDVTMSYPFRLVVVDNGSKGEHQDVLNELSENRNVHVMRRIQADVDPKYAASRHHGEAIQHAISNLPHSHIGIVVDCDSRFVKNKWDELVISYLEDFKHVSCKRPSVKYGCGAWFSAFRVGTLIENEISFLPILKPNGFDCPRPNLYDVGSDMIRLDPWKPVKMHPKLRFHSHGHVWTIDGIPFLDHMGGCRCFDDFNEWKKWTEFKIRDSYRD